MNQGKIKLKELENQLTFDAYCQTPKNQQTQRSRSQSLQRKKPPSPQSPDIVSDSKKHIRENSEPSKEVTTINSGEMAELDRLKPSADKLVESDVTELDSKIVKALEFLLKPIRDDINNLQSKVHAEIRESAKLHDENIQLHLHVQKAEERNVELSNRLCELENKMLESHVMLHGIPEGPWETDEDHQEKIFIAISNTLLGRTKEERLNVARRMLIRCSKRIGPYQAM